MIATTVAIAGGGPAGAVAALTLARLGVRVDVFEAAAEPQDKVGECLPPSARPLFERLGLTQQLESGEHVRSYGNRSCWGSDEPRERDFLLGLHGAGLHVDRRVFEATLAREAIRCGACWHFARPLRAVERRHRGWTFDGGAAEFLVDASGRRAAIARRLGVRRISHDRLVGLATVMEASGGEGTADTFTLVEAVPYGWWYSALLPQGRLMVALLTDHDLAEFRMARRSSAWRELLAGTKATWARVREHDYQPAGPCRILPANSARLSAIAGERWLAVGDAAAAYDPLSSHGITSAMGCGYYAARAVAHLLSGRPEAELAYLSILEKSYALYLEEQRKCYLAETRWPEHEFWKRRHQPAGAG